MENTTLGTILFFFSHLQVYAIRIENRLDSKSKYTNEWVHDECGFKKMKIIHIPRWGKKRQVFECSVHSAAFCQLVMIMLKARGCSRSITDMLQ